MAPAPDPRRTVIRRRASLSPTATEGPLLPGELRPVADTPAASESGDGPMFTEAQLLRMLIRHYRWIWAGRDQLLRYNPHRRQIRAEVEALADA